MEHSSYILCLSSVGIKLGNSIMFVKKIYLPMVIIMVLTSKFSLSKPLDLKHELRLLPASASYALLIIDPATGKLVHDENSDKLMPPASLQKLITALATKLILPDQFRFITQLEKSGRDIVVRFSGDPALTYDDLYNLFDLYKKKHGQIIRGDIILDGSIFTGHNLPQGITWENLSACYSAPSSAFNLDKNCAEITLNSHLPMNQLATVQKTTQPIFVESSALISNKTQIERSFCEFDALYFDKNHYAITGCINQSSHPLILKFAIQDPNSYVKAAVRSMLRDLKIKLKGEIKSAQRNSGHIIAVHQSDTINSYIAEMLLESDNLIAETLVRMLGKQFFSVPGSFSSGLAAIEAILMEQASIDLAQCHLSSGSGLSRNDRITAKKFMEILQFIHRHDNTLNLIELLPVAGLSGTLKNRFTPKNHRLTGKIQAKTGYIFSTYNLAGIIQTESGKPLLFIQLITDYLPQNSSMSKQERMAALRSFENAFYTRLLKWLPTS